jgi:hypothetical protein
LQESIGRLLRPARQAFSLDFVWNGEVYILDFTSANHGPESDFELFTPIADDDGEGYKRIFLTPKQIGSEVNAGEFHWIEGF